MRAEGRVCLQMGEEVNIVWSPLYLLPNYWGWLNVRVNLKHNELKLSTKANKNTWS